MSKITEATDIVCAVLLRHTSAVPAKTLLDAVEAAGYTRNVGYQVMTAGVVERKFKRTGSHGAYSYQLSDAHRAAMEGRQAEAEKESGEAAYVAPAQLTPSVGLVCGQGSGAFLDDDGRQSSLAAELESERDDSGVVVALTPSAIARAKRPAGLFDRLISISADLRDAIGDCCDDELPHPVIKALVDADSATQAALRKLAA